MRSRWILVVTVLLTGVLAVGMACGDDDEGGDVNVGGGDNPTSTRAAGTRTEAADTGDDTAQEFSAIVTGVDDDAIVGTVVISEGGDGVDVEVAIEGLPEGPHANHLHHGTCEAQGEVHVTLEELDADAQGSASGETTFADPPLEHFATGHYYAVHDGIGAVIGCGNVVPSS